MHQSVHHTCKIRDLCVEGVRGSWARDESTNRLGPGGCIGRAKPALCTRPGVFFAVGGVFGHRAQGIAERLSTDVLDFFQDGDDPFEESCKKVRIELAKVREVNRNAEKELRYVLNTSSPHGAAAPAPRRVSAGSLASAS